MLCLFKRLNQTAYKKLIWALAISETLHNLEETIWMPAKSQSFHSWQAPVTAFEFRFAVIVLTLLIYAVIYFFSKKEHPALNFMMAGVLLAILFNVFVPHLVGSIILGDFIPGVVTGVLFNLPVTFYLLWRGLREKLYTFKTLLLGGIVFSVIGLALIPVCFSLADLIQTLF